MGTHYPHNSHIMKVFICMSALLAVSTAMPRFLVIPLEDLEYVPQGLPVMYQQGLARQARQAQDGFEPNQQYLEDQEQAARRAFARQSEEGIYERSDDAAGSASNAYAAPHAGGADHVDYGAYTGGYGAFGWYTDHPVLLGAGHH